MARPEGTDRTRIAILEIDNKGRRRSEGPDCRHLNGATVDIYFDFELRSRVKLQDVGVYNYVLETSTEILSMAYSIGGIGAIRTWVPGEDIDPRFFAADNIYHAHNAEFERLVWAYVATRQLGWRNVPEISQWRCTAARAARAGLPRALEKAALAMGFPEPFQKDMAGHRVMQSMTKPRRPSKHNDAEWFDDAVRYKKLLDYNEQDVRVECELASQLPEMSRREQRLWELDQDINDWGIPLDGALINVFRLLEKEARQRGDAELSQLTEGKVPTVTSVAKFVAWLGARGVPVESIDRASVATLLEDDLPRDVRKALEIRKSLSLSSTRKLSKMEKGSTGTRVSSVRRFHGGHLFYGGHTGRWSGRGIQIQNLPQGFSELEQELAIECLIDDKAGRTAMEILLGHPLTVISKMLRGCICAPCGYMLVVADFAQIEARVLAWLAGEDGLLQAFRDGVDPYVLMAAAIYGCKPENVTSEQRQLGKVAELACGYQMGAKRFHKTASDWGVPVDENLAERAVNAYRASHPKIVSFWHANQRAARRAIELPGQWLGVRVQGGTRVRYLCKEDWLVMELPSGRRLMYREPSIEKNSETGWDEIRYWGEDSVTRQWTRQKTYGGKLVENLDQATACDVLADSLLAMHPHVNVTFHVHDEIVVEAKEEDAKKTLDWMLLVMRRVPAWLKGCPIDATGFVAQRYRK